MQDILGELNRVRGVGGCLLFNSDGLLMESMLRSDVDEQALAASGGALIAQATRMCEALGIGRQTAFSANGDQGGVMVLAAGQATLLVLLDPSANLALLRLELKPFLERITSRLTL
jgi:predicted regulator of Ras-like GTPase activity (Roadblock/LC7/MglB family)